MQRRSSGVEKICSVSQINQYIKNLFVRDYLLSRVQVQGEISNLKYHSSGHIYFTLKDEAAQISCVMFASYTRGMTFRLEEGQNVLVYGSISVYERDGRYQLYARDISMQGAGKLYEEYEKRKKRLLEEGLFDEENKKPIPKYAKTIGVVTAQTGAVIQDICNVTHRRNPYVQIRLYPAKVQGEGAAQTVIRGIRYFEKTDVDTIIIGRGGGSIEDLWAFNEEQVAWAIFNAETPIISATGHEIDTTVADMVADRRESNPSTAVMHALPVVAETVAGFDRRLEQLTMLISGRIDRLARSLDGYDRQLRLLSPSGRMDSQRQQLDRIEKQINELMADKIEDRSMRCDRLHDRMKSAMVRKYDMTRNALAVMTERIHGLSPTAKLINGFGYISSDGEPVRSVVGITPGDDIEITLHDGRIQAVVADVTGQEE